MKPKISLNLSYKVYRLREGSKLFNTYPNKKLLLLVQYKPFALMELPQILSILNKYHN